MTAHGKQILTLSIRLITCIGLEVIRWLNFDSKSAVDASNTGVTKDDAVVCYFYCIFQGFRYLGYMPFKSFQP
ncbi:hypothetical protein GcM3_03724 [Golovinomyces cichoracearum]|uniref:Uncharacterized protein n=1 Tax=Golovinomyces cichoracearum TaxID=62708 RepID=A0A420HQF5_9PEZI|nr:hypothetical protein GcM3_03724 [Golovinomyces cichoracearum]